MYLIHRIHSFESIWKQAACWTQTGGREEEGKVDVRNSDSGLGGGETFNIKYGHGYKMVLNLSWENL